MAEDTITTPPVTGSPDGTGSQAADKAGQPDNQLQDTGAPKVEGSEQHTSSQTSERPKASEFYNARRSDKQWKTGMEGQIQQLSGQLQEIGSLLKKQKESSDEPKFPTDSEMQELLATDTNKWAQERERKMKHELEKTLKQVKEVEVPNIIKQNEEAKKKQQESEQFATKEREALELLFPKTSSEDASDIDERRQKNPERTKRILEILNSTGLNEASYADPVKAAKGALRILELEGKLQRNSAGGTTKAQMGSVTPTGAMNNNGGSKTMTLQEVQSENDKMYKELDDHPELRYDDKWNARRETLKKELGRMIEDGQK